MDILFARENEESLYAGVALQQTEEVVQCLDLICRPGFEKTIHHVIE